MRTGIGSEFDLADQESEREFTLGPALLIGVGICVVLLCVLCFWLGLTIGRSGTTSQTSIVKQTAEGQAASPATTSSLSKPLAAGLLPSTLQEPAETATPKPFGGDQSPVDNALTSYAPSGGGPAASGDQPIVKPALPINSNATSSAGALSPVPTIPNPASQAGRFMVQIAALSQVQDARALVNALHQRGYNAVSVRESSDGMIHVRVGPFATRAQANEMSQKLLGDGYNAEVQP
jgi:cell division septation protein DedD